MIIAALALRLGATAPLCQEPLAVSMSVGWNVGAYKEATCGQIIQRLSDPRFQLGASFRRGSLTHVIQADYSASAPGSVMTEVPVIYQEYDPLTGEPYYAPILSSCRAHRASLSYALLADGVRGERSGLSLGGEIRADAYVQLANYPSVTGIVSVGPRATHAVRMSPRDAFEASATVPIVGWAVRPPYAGADALLMKYAEESPLRVVSLGRVVSLHNYQAVFLSADYRHRVSGSITLRTGVDLEASRIAVPAGRPRRDLSVAFRSGLQWSF